jgi:hypothetical protein
MISYIIKDNNDILGVYKNLNDAYDYIIFLNTYLRKKTNYNLINNIKIYKYKNNIIKDIFYINSKLKLIIYDQDNEDKNNGNDEELSEINIFIPNETEINNDNNDINIDDLKEKINLLEKLKDHEVLKLQDLKEDYINKEEKYIEEKIKIDNKKLKLKQEQEKWDSIKKKFEADKKLYCLFKQEIKDNTRKEEEIPELFKDIYPIFQKMDNEGYLNTIQEINKYVELLNN